MQKGGKVVVLLYILATLALLVAGQEDDEITVPPPRRFVPGILDLTADNFDDFLENNEDPLLLEIYADVCEQCTGVEETMIQAQEEARAKGFNFTLARISRDAEFELSRIFRYKDAKPPPLPHLHFRSKPGRRDLGNWQAYNEAFEVTAILRYISIASRSTSPTKLKTIASVDAFIEQANVLTPLDNPFSEKPALVGFFPRNKHSVELRRFKTFIDELRTRRLPLLKEVAGAVGIHFVKNPASSIVFRNKTISFPSLVLFKRNGVISEYNPPLPGLSAVTPEEAKTEEAVQEQQPEQENEEEKESENEDEGSIFFGNEEGKLIEEETQEVQKKKEKLPKEEKKRLKQEAWKKLQRASSWRVVHMIRWLLDATQPVVAEVGHWNFNEILQRGKPVYTAWVDMRPTSREEAGETIYYEDTLATLLRIAKDYPQFSYGIVGGDRYPAIAKAFGVTSGFGYVIMDPDQEDKFLPEGTLLNNEEEEAFIRKHIQDFLAGTLEPFVRSGPEPPPQENEDNPNVNVKTVVQSNFKRIVLDDTKDVLIEYYRRECPHCPALVPLLEELGKRLSDDKNVLITKMELDNNDLPKAASVRLEAFPSVFLYPAGDKSNPINYADNKAVASFLAFIQRHRTTAPSSPGISSRPRKQKAEL